MKGGTQLWPGGQIKTYLDGEWHDGAIPLISSVDLGGWLGACCFDGGRFFRGTIPDLDQHCGRLCQSAAVLGMTPPVTPKEVLQVVVDGCRLSDPENETSGRMFYVRPFMWSSGIADWTALPVPSSKPEHCRFAVTIEELPTVLPGAPPPPLPKMTVCYEMRKCNLSCAPTNAKMPGLYPQYGKMQLWANGRGFQKVLGLDAHGNVAETESANVFMVKDRVVYTPVPNGTFLNGITRRRVIKLLRAAGVRVVEATLFPSDFANADEIFTTGNIGKVGAVGWLDERNLCPDGKPGPITLQAKGLYDDWAKDKSLDYMQGLQTVEHELESTASSSAAAPSGEAGAGGAPPRTKTAASGAAAASASRLSFEAGVLVGGSLALMGFLAGALRSSKR